MKRGLIPWLWCLASAVLLVLALCVWRESPDSATLTRTRTMPSNVGNVLLVIFATMLHDPRRHQITFGGRGVEVDALYRRAGEFMKTQPMASACWLDEPPTDFDAKDDMKMVTVWEYGSREAASHRYWNAHGVTMRAMVRHATEPPPGGQTCDAVVHVRFGDIPYVRLNHPDTNYHLQGWRYYRDAFRRLDLAPGSRLRLVYSTSWQSEPEWQRASERYIERIVQEWRRWGYDVKTQSGALVEDFATLVHAPKLVGCVSSFSFVAGIGRDPTEFCMPQMGREIEGQYVFNAQSPPWMSRERPVLHRTVRAAGLRYEDADAVVDRCFGSP